MGIERKELKFGGFFWGEKIKISKFFEGKNQNFKFFWEKTKISIFFRKKPKISFKKKLFFFKEKNGDLGQIWVKNPQFKFFSGVEILDFDQIWGKFG